MEEISLKYIWNGDCREKETKTLEEILSKYNKDELSEMIYKAIRGLSFDELLYYEHFLI